uniref:Structural maintenance of chromosomes protein n=1 Tax=Strongyloides papillosus TaxID=174720 RepID=A0A0N5B2I2_STREA
MYIKEICIHNFRSYKDKTVINDLSKRHNVVVGRNGSGKSNFFFAIQFLLSDEFANLSQDARLNLLHEGAGEKVRSARVDIVFDNSDRRIMSYDINDLKISREISERKDTFYIDGKIVSRSEIVNLMESAGFSKSNPYYIVKQGKIMELATSTDAQRLALIKEVAGTRVYDEKKQDSAKLLKENMDKLQKIEETIEFINERLKTLEEESNDLREYQKYDKMKRALEYTIYEQEATDSRKKLDNLSHEREELNSQQNEIESSLLQYKQQSMKRETDLRRLEATFKGVKEEREVLLEEQNVLVEKKTNLELCIADLREEADRERKNRARAEEEMTSVGRIINDRELELEELEPLYKDVVERENNLLTDIKICEQKRKDLYIRQGQQDQFRTTEDRDNYLRRECKKMDRYLSELRERVTESESSIEQDKKETEEIQKDIMSLKLKLDRVMDRMDRLSGDQNQAKAHLEKCTIRQGEIQREEKNWHESMMNLNQEKGQVETDIRRMIPPSLMHGMNSIKKAITYFKENNKNGKYDYIINGYYGTLIDLIEADDIFYQAIETTAGNSIYYSVVEDDRIASEITSYINSSNLPGECNFCPLNRVVAKPRKLITDPEAKHIMDCMKYDPKFDTIIRSFFGQTAVVGSLDVGGRVSKNDHINCVTLDGDKISRRGPLTGGYREMKRSKLELNNVLRQLNGNETEMKKRSDEISRRANEASIATAQASQALENITDEIKRLRREHHLCNEELSHKTEALNRMGMNIEPQRQHLQTHKNKIREIEAKKEILQNQIGTPLHSTLTDEEQAMLEHLEKDMKLKKEKLDEIVRERSTIESKKHKIENELQNYLRRRREKLRCELQDISMEDKKHKLSSTNSELKSTNERLSNIMEKVNDIDTSLIDYKVQKDNLIKAKEEQQEKIKVLESQLNDVGKRADVVCTKLATIRSTNEEVTKKMAELGTLPQDAFKKFQNLSRKKLDEKLTECLVELKKYSNVNKRALDQFLRASQQKEDLVKRVQEQKKSKKAIENLIEVLDNRKNEALNMTFKMVTKHFHNVFKQLIPEGKADLILKLKDDDGPVPGENELISVDRFAGVKIKCTFRGDAESVEMNHLSGGQKTLIALALIFAIQKCDPAPFYLFDEIDAALDAAHRSSVANMIHELSENAQFITTTFRPQLLEHAEKYYGVRFRNRVSHIDPVTKEQAYDFITDAEKRN